MIGVHKLCTNDYIYMHNNVCIISVYAIVYKMYQSIKQLFPVFASVIATNT